MGIAILIFAIIFVVYITSKAEQAMKLKIATEMVRRCPPHQWEWVTIFDKDGNKVTERIVCKVCGPLSNSIARSAEQ